MKRRNFLKMFALSPLVLLFKPVRKKFVAKWIGPCGIPFYLRVHDVHNHGFYSDSRSWEVQEYTDQPIYNPPSEVLQEKTLWNPNVGKFINLPQTHSLVIARNRYEESYEKLVCEYEKHTPTYYRSQMNNG